MAAADYYNTGAQSQSQGGGLFDGPGRQDSHHSQHTSPSGDLNKPLPPSFPPTHADYNNDDLSYAPNHYSMHSIDTAYDPHTFDPTNPYGSNKRPPNQNDNPFADNIPLQNNYGAYPAAEAGQAGLAAAGKSRKKHKKPGGIKGFLGVGDKRRKPWFTWFITTVQIAVFIGQLARSWQLVGSPISTKPYFNPMLGPSAYVQIDMGARYVPCMRKVKGYNDDTSYFFPCPNTTSDTIYSNSSCNLAQMCGFSGNNIPSEYGGKGGKGTEPNQWWRFIVPMFLHAGLIHIAFNMFVQLYLGADMERAVGPLRFGFIYFAAGIFGFVLGGNLGQLGQPSVGASGCLFGIFALTFLDIFYTWRDRRTPGRDLIFLCLDIAVSFVIGLLPGVDNFAHIGGFLAGITLGLSLMHSPNVLRERIGLRGTDPPYTSATPNNPYNNSSGDKSPEGIGAFVKQPVGFFKGRRPAWWAWWAIRAATLTGILVAFIVLLNNFYKYHNDCGWCKYLSCLDVSNWCSIGELPEQNVTTTPRMMARGLGFAEL